MIILRRGKTSTIFKQRRTKVIEKELFSGKFISFLVSLFKRMKDSNLVEFYNAAFRRFMKTFRKFAGKRLSQRVLVH